MSNITSILSYITLGSLLLLLVVVSMLRMLGGYDDDDGDARLGVGDRSRWRHQLTTAAEK